MHKSDNPDNFRNKKYLDAMRKEFKRTFSAYHRYIAYKNKLQTELTMSEEDIEEMRKINRKYKNNLERASQRTDREDFLL